jgi:hypothetical protein
MLVYTGVAVLVIGSTLLRIREDFVGFLGFLEMLFRFGVIRIAVRMVLHGELAVRLLDVFIGSIFVNAQYFV